MNDQSVAARGPANLPRMRVYVLVWLGLLLIVAVEVVLTYTHPPAGTLLALLLGLAALEAVLAVLYFMHLRYERRILFWTLIPTLVFVLFMLNQLWFDAVRLRDLHP